jgi:hypothetical protein
MQRQDQVPRRIMVMQVYTLLFLKCTMTKLRLYFLKEAQYRKFSVRMFEKYPKLI